MTGFAEGSDFIPIKPLDEKMAMARQKSIRSASITGTLFQ